MKRCNYSYILIFLLSYFDYLVCYINKLNHLKYRILKDLQLIAGPHFQTLKHNLL